MTAELKQWFISQDTDKLLKMIDDGEIAKVISICPVRLREDLYQLLLELHSDETTDLDLNTSITTSTDGKYYGLKYSDPTSAEDKYIAVKKAKNNVYPVTSVTSLGRGIKGVVFCTQREAMTFVKKLRSTYSDIRALPYIIPKGSVRNDYVEIETECGPALISSEAKTKLDTVQRTPVKVLAENNIRTKQTKYLQSVFPQRAIRELLRQNVFNNENYLQFSYYNDQVVVRWPVTPANEENVTACVLNATSDFRYAGGSRSSYIFKLLDEAPLSEIAKVTYEKYGVPEEEQNKWLLHPYTYRPHISQ